MTRLLLCGLLFAAACHAQIYKSVDDQGNVTFSDRPPAASESAETVELRPLNTQPAPASPPRATPAPEPDRQDEDATGAVLLRILTPQPDQVIPIGELGNLTVSVEVEPPLTEGEQLQLLLDGSPRGEPQRASQWQLEELPRGGHDLQINRLGAQGEVRASSDSVRFYVMRPLNIRNRPSTAAPQ